MMLAGLGKACLSYDLISYLVFERRQAVLIEY